MTKQKKDSSNQKKYYWIKLKDTFMTSDAVDFLMSQKNGANYVVLYQLLCLKTVNTGGRLEREIGEILIPYDAIKIQRDCKYFDLDTVIVAIDLYKKLGLIYQENDGTLLISNYENLVGSETNWAKSKRIQRQKGSKKALDNVPKMSNESPLPCPQNVHTETRDKRQETRHKILDIQTDCQTVGQSDGKIDFLISCIEGNVERESENFKTDYGARVVNICKQVADKKSMKINQAEIQSDKILEAVNDLFRVPDGLRHALELADSAGAEIKNRFGYTVAVLYNKAKGI